MEERTKSKHPLLAESERTDRLEKLKKSRGKSCDYLVYGEQNVKDRRVIVGILLVVVTVDADHAGCSETRRSTSSGVIQVNDHVLSEWSTTQSTVALSSGESEFVAIVKGVVMGLFTRNLLNELGWCITQVVIRSDSSAGRGMASRPGVGRRSKHFETKSLFAQHLIKDGLVVLEPVHTKLNTADIGTKCFDAPTMRKLIGLLGVRLLTLDGAVARSC